MIVTTSQVGLRKAGPAADTSEVAVPAGTHTLGELLAVLVRHELDGYERQRTVSQTLRILTPADLAVGVDTGVYGREARALPNPPTEDDAIQRATQAFTDGLFFVFLDDLRVETLDAPVDVRPESAMRLVRLTALTGA